MNFSVSNSLSKTSNILNLISERQKLIGTNLANMDTPNYQKRDIDFSQILGGSTSSLETKLAQKFDGGGMFASQTSEDPVNATEELVKMQNNSLLYTVATRRMSNIITQMKTVVNVGK